MLIFDLPAQLCTLLSKSTPNSWPSNCWYVTAYFTWAIPGLSFSLCSSFQHLTMFGINFPKTGFEPQIPGIGSDHCANWATTTSRVTACLANVYYAKNSSVGQLVSSSARQLNRQFESKYLIIFPKISLKTEGTSPACQKNNYFFIAFISLSLSR